jgi:hypothetical protein
MSGLAQIHFCWNMPVAVGPLTVRRSSASSRSIDVSIFFLLIELPRFATQAGSVNIVDPRSEILKI